MTAADKSLLGSIVAVIGEIQTRIDNPSAPEGSALRPDVWAHLQQIQETLEKVETE